MNFTIDKFIHHITDHWDQCVWVANRHFLIPEFVLQKSYRDHLVEALYRELWEYSHHHIVLYHEFVWLVHWGLSLDLIRPESQTVSRRGTSYSEVTEKSSIITTLKVTDELELERIAGEFSGQPHRGTIFAEMRILAIPGLSSTDQ